jgi:hypothetical protein
MKKLTFLIIGTILTIGLLFADEPKHSVKREAGFVPDEKTAIAIAVWLPIYGEEIQKQKPFKAVLKDGVWHVEGTLPAEYTGGVALAEISKKDARILRISHGK